MGISQQLFVRYEVKHLPKIKGKSKVREFTYRGKLELEIYGVFKERGERRSELRLDTEKELNHD